MTNRETITDLRLVADATSLQPLRDEANYYADSLEPKQNDKTLQEWIKSKGPRSSPSLLTNNEKTVLRGLLDALQDLYEKGRCHGRLNSTTVLISTNDEVNSAGALISTISEVKLVNLQFIPCTLNNMDKDYLDLAKLIEQFHPLPPDVQHFVKHLRGPKWDKYAIYIFNPVFLWDTNQIFMVIEYLTNKSLRYVPGQFNQEVHDALEIALRICYPNGWTSRIRASVLSKNLKGSEHCLARFIRDVYAHPPVDQNGVLLDQEGVTRTFLGLFPEFLPELVILLLKGNAVKPGDPIDSNYIGGKGFCLV